MSKKAKFDEVQIKNGALSDLGKRIATHLTKARQYEAEAREKADVPLRKADDNLVTAAQLLAEAKPQCRGEGFKVFKEKYAPDISRSRVYELLSIGCGKKTEEQVRAESRERKAKSRASSVTSPLVTDKSIGLGNGEACEKERAVTEKDSVTRLEVRLEAEANNGAAEPEAEITETAEASAEKRKPEYANAELDDEKKADKPAPERTVVTKATLMAILQQISLLGFTDRRVGSAEMVDVPDCDLELFDDLHKASDRLRDLAYRIADHPKVDKELTARHRAKEAQEKAKREAEQKARRTRKRAERKAARKRAERKAAEQAERVAA